MLATKSVGNVSVSGAGGKGAWAGGEGVSGAERSSTAFFIIRTMSWNCCSESWVSLAQSVG